MAGDDTIERPVKTREMVQWVIDSRPWNTFAFRDDDVVIGTWSKAGTTWMQQIVAQLVFGGRADMYGPQHSPWIDSRLSTNAVERAEAQTHRRFLKTHLPVDALVHSPKVKYLYIGRDLRDVYWSWHNHHANFQPEILDFINGLPGREGPPVGYPDPDISAAYRNWLERDGWPCWPFFSHVQVWWDARHAPNIALFHFADMKADPEREIRRVARFLEIEVDPAAWPAILEYCSFAHMKALAAADPSQHRVFKGGGETFINKGTNGRWREVLSAEDVALGDAKAAQHLSEDCARWLASGQLQG